MAQRRSVGRRQGERGQMVLLFALLIVPVSLALGVAATDVTLWQSERRGAQKDADLSALAGAFELLSVDQDADVARAAANEYADINDEADNAEVVGEPVVDNSCFNSQDANGDPILDSVWVTIEHKSRTFFADAFGLSVPQIGAKARACMGSPIEGKGLLPIGVQVLGTDSECFQDHDNDPATPEIPIFGQFCRLLFDTDDTGSGEGGLLKLYDDGSIDCSSPTTGGSKTVQEEIENGGADTTCYVAPPGTTSEDCDDPPPEDWPYDVVNYCVWPKTQTGSPPPIQRSFEELLSTEGECDAAAWGNGDGKDDWLEVVEATNGDPNPDPGTTTFARRDCESPRLVTLIIILQFDELGNDPAPILAFASFYIEGCMLDGVLYPTCEITGGGTGQTSLYGFFMNILEIGAIGAANDYGQRSIALWE